jgi:ABC-type multidrug transport system fused ATPase/permease subunit
VQGYAYGIVGSSLAERLRRAFFDAVLHMEVAWFDYDANTSGALAARLSSDAPAVRGAVADTLAALVQNVTTLAVGYAIAFLNGWKMTLVITAIIPFLGFATYVQMMFYSGASALLACAHACSACIAAVALPREGKRCPHTAHECMRQRAYSLLTAIPAQAQCQDAASCNAHRP